MSYIENPEFGLYGAWEAANPDCVAKGLAVNNNTKMIQLLFASICTCQVIFMASRAPRVTWEAVYLPFVETILYGMSASGNGSIRLADGRMVPIARFCSWLITCPIMLFQIVGIFELKWKGVPCKNMVMAASLIRTVFGIGASVCSNPTMRWVQYVLSCGFFFFELFVVATIFKNGLAKFGAVKTKLNNVVLSRLLLLRFLFFLSWLSFPIVWLLSSTGLCLIDEDGSVLAYLIADLICKNLYGIINANTLFRVLNGKWIAETEEEANKPKDPALSNHVGETYFEQIFAGIRSSARKPAHPDAAAGALREDVRIMKEVRIDEADAGYHDRAALDRSAVYSEKMRCKNPEEFLDDRDLPRLSPPRLSPPRLSPDARDRDYPLALGRDAGYPPVERRGSALLNAYQGTLKDDIPPAYAAERRASREDLYVPERRLSRDDSPGRDRVLRMPSRGPAEYRDSPSGRVDNDGLGPRDRDGYDDRRSYRDRDPDRDSDRDRDRGSGRERSRERERDEYRERERSRERRDERDRR